MFREAIIPQVNDGKPFEAYGAREVPSNSMGVCLTTCTHQISFIPVDSIEDLEATRASITFQLAKALNPPIKVTQAVLEAMGKVPEAKFSLVLDDKPWKSPETRRRTTTLFFNPHPENVCWYGYPDGDTYNMERIGIVKDEDGEDDDYIDSGYIQADCPLALQVLLGFTTEGVPK